MSGVYDVLQVQAGLPRKTDARFQGSWTGSSSPKRGITDPVVRVKAVGLNERHKREEELKLSGLMVRGPWGLVSPLRLVEEVGEENRRNGDGRIWRASSKRNGRLVQVQWSNFA